MYLDIALSNIITITFSPVDDNTIFGVSDSLKSSTCSITEEYESLIFLILITDTVMAVRVAAINTRLHTFLNLYRYIQVAKTSKTTRTLIMICDNE